MLVLIGIFEQKPMAKNTGMHWGGHFDRFIATQLQQGRYGSATAVARAGLRLLETEEELHALRRLIDEGRKSGTAESQLRRLHGGTG